MMGTIKAFPQSRHLARGVVINLALGTCSGGLKPGDQNAYDIYLFTSMAVLIYLGFSGDRRSLIAFNGWEGV